MPKPLEMPGSKGKGSRKSHVESISYDPTTRRMVIEFASGSRYAYPDVSPEDHAEFAAADSLGSHLHNHIKPKYKGVKQ